MLSDIIIHAFKIASNFTTKLCACVCLFVCGCVRVCVKCAASCCAVTSHRTSRRARTIGPAVIFSERAIEFLQRPNGTNRIRSIAVEI